MSAFYSQVDDSTFESSPMTAGPWSPKLQHGGPPSALLGRAFEHFQPRENFRLARISFEILRPIPVGPLSVEVRALSLGKRTELLEGTITCEGKEVVTARAQRFLASPETTPALQQYELVAPAMPTEPATVAWPGAYIDGYISAVEWREAKGSFEELGSAITWARPKFPLVAGEEFTPWTRTLCIADSVSGIGMTISPLEFQIINTDVTVMLHRDPVGEWICMSGGITSSPNGSGIAEGNLWDQSGPIGRVNQSMFIAAWQ